MNINPQIFTARYRKAMRDPANDNEMPRFGGSSPEWIVFDEAFSVTEDMWDRFKLKVKGRQPDRLAQCYALVEALFDSIDQLPGHEVAHVLKRINERMGRDG